MKGNAVLKQSPYQNHKIKTEKLYSGWTVWALYQASPEARHSLMWTNKFLLLKQSWNFKSILTENVWIHESKEWILHPLTLANTGLGITDRSPAEMGGLHDALRCSSRWALQIPFEWFSHTRRTYTVGLGKCNRCITMLTKMSTSKWVLSAKQSPRESGYGFF